MSENSEIYFTAIKILGKEKYDAYLRAAEVTDISFLDLIALSLKFFSDGIDHNGSHDRTC